MTKMKFYKQARTMYIEENIPIDVIYQRLHISRRTLFYWKKKYDWDKKRQEAMYDKTLFKEDLQKFVQKLMARIANSKQRKIQISQAEYYSLVNILKLFPELKEHETPNKTPQNKKELSPDFIRQIEREILGIEYS